MLMLHPEGWDSRLIESFERVSPTRQTEMHFVELSFSFDDVFREVRNSNTTAKGSFKNNHGIRAFDTGDRLDFFINDIPEMPIVFGVDPDHDIIASGSVDAFGDLGNFLELIHYFTDVLGMCQDELAKGTRLISEYLRVEDKHGFLQETAVPEFFYPLMDQ